MRKTRESLANELSEVISESARTVRQPLAVEIWLSTTYLADDFGPKLWVNFHQSRLRPAASVPQTGENPGLMYRKGDGADSSVLSHPMLWLDERIFGESFDPSSLPAWNRIDAYWRRTGWSRSAAKGPNVWNAKPRSEFGSPPLSPTESDTEETGGADVDYDDVLAIIDTRRSRNDVRASGLPYSSRNQPSETIETNYQENADEDAVRRRKPRTRSESLNHAVTAEQLAESSAREGSANFASVSSEFNKDGVNVDETRKGTKAE